MRPDNADHAAYIPIDRSRYTLADHLTEEERSAISAARRRTAFQERTRPVPVLLQPLRDIARLSGIPSRMARATIQAVLAETYHTNAPCWTWSEDVWQRLLNNVASADRCWRLSPGIWAPSGNRWSWSGAASRHAMPARYSGGTFFTRNAVG